MRYKMVVYTAIVTLIFSSGLSAQEYSYHPRSDFSIEDIDVHDGRLWLAASGVGAVHFDPGTGDYTVMTEKDGLYSSDVLRTIKVDSRGTIWFGMGQGLIEYDGETMIRYDYDTGISLADFYDIYEAFNGTMWFAARDGVFSLIDESWTRYDANSGMGGPPYKHILPSPDGSLWASCKHKISNFLNSEWTTYTPPLGRTEYNNLEIFSMLIDPESIVWIGTNQGVMKFDDDEWTIYTVDDGLTGNACHAIGQDTDGVIWAATGPDQWSMNSFSVFDGESWTAHPDIDKIISAKIISVHKDEDCTLWFGAENCELYSVKNGTIDAVHVETGVNSSWIHAIAVDQDNTVWTGSKKGVQSLKNGRWRTYYQRDGLPAGQVRDLVVTESGTVWAVADSGAAYFDGDRWHAFASDVGLLGTTASSVSSAGDVVWFGTESGLIRYSNGNWASYTVQDGLPDDSIKAVLAGSETDVWVGTGKGLARFDGESWVTFTTADGLPDIAVTTILRDPRGILWAGTPNGLAAYYGAGWTTYHMDDGESSLPDNHIKAMTVDRSDRIWFGTEKGSTWFDGSEWGADYKFNYIFDLAVDRDNVLWGARFSSDGRIMSHILEDDGAEENQLPGTLEIKNSTVIVQDMAVTNNSIWIVVYPEIMRYDKATGSMSESLVLVDARPKEITALSDEKVYLISTKTELTGADVFHKFDGSTWIYAGQMSAKTRSLVMDPGGNVWYHYFSVHGLGFVNSGLGIGSPEFSAHCIFFASDKTVWMGGDLLVQSRIPYHEKFKASWDDWRVIERPEEIYHISTIAEDLNGDILVGTNFQLWSPYYGLARYDGGNWTLNTEENGLLSNKISDIEIDHRGAIWISTDKGISYFNGENWIDITKENSILPRNDYNIIEVDSDGVVWIGCVSQGLLSFTYDASVQVEKTKSEPKALALADVFPNPFNPSTSITYSLEKSGKVTLSVYSISGQKVRELASGTMQAGKYVTIWDGRNDTGERVSSGVYFALLSDGSLRSVKRMLLLK